MAKRRPAETPAQSDSRRAITKGRGAIADSRQMMLDTAATIDRSIAASVASQARDRPLVILQVGPRDFSVLMWLRDEGETPVYRVVKERIKAASTAGVLARKLMQAARRP